MVITNWIIAVSIVCVACAACQAADIPATRPQVPPKTLAELKKENQDNFAAQWRGLPPLPTMPVAQIVHFTIEHDRLILDSPIPATSGVQYAIPLSDMPAEAIFRITNARSAIAGANGARPGFKFISFETYDFSDPALIDRHLQVLGQPANLQVVHDIEYLDRKHVQWMQDVQLIETSDPRENGQITVRVEIDPDSGPAPPFKLVISAPSFVALRSEYPAEFEQYVRPAFVALRQDPIVLGIDSKVAWQVLGDTARPSPDIASKVSALLAQFNADDFSTRAAAEKQLQALGEPAALYLMSSDRSKLAPEQKARCDKFLAVYRPLTDEQARAFRSDVNFLLDCLYSEDPAERSAALDHLSRAVGPRISFDLDAPAAQRTAAIAELRKQLSPVAAPGGADK
jgi:hypothetical protein